MDWTRILTRKDLARFLQEMSREVAEDVIYFAPQYVIFFCDEHEDELRWFIRRYEYELEDDYSDII